MVRKGSRKGCYQQPFLLCFMNASVAHISDFPWGDGTLQGKGLSRDKSIPQGRGFACRGDASGICRASRALCGASCRP